MNAQRITYGTRITSGDHRRWCPICSTQRSTINHRFVEHWKPNAKPNDPPCPNSGMRVDKVEQAG